MSKKPTVTAQPSKRSIIRKMLLEGGHSTEEILRTSKATFQHFHHYLVELRLRGWDISKVSSWKASEKK